jgi:hypothetical protein
MKTIDGTYWAGTKKYQCTIWKRANNGLAPSKSVAAR